MATAWTPSASSPTQSGYLLGFARVFTAEQSVDLQTDGLTDLGCWRIWTDSASSALEHRPQLEAVMEALRSGDTLVVWRLDRLNRSLRHLIDVVADLDARGVGFWSLREAIDTTTPGGRLVFHLFGALAQFEREIIRDRMMAGLAAARARGRSGGRPPKLSPAQQGMARRLFAGRAYTVTEIGQLLGVSRTSFYRTLGKQPAADPAAAASPAASTPPTSGRGTPAAAVAVEASDASDARTPRGAVRAVSAATSKGTTTPATASTTASTPPRRRPRTRVRPRTSSRR